MPQTIKIAEEAPAKPGTPGKIRLNIDNDGKVFVELWDHIPGQPANTYNVHKYEMAEEDISKLRAILLR